MGFLSTRVELGFHFRVVVKSSSVPARQRMLNTHHGVEVVLAAGGAQLGGVGSSLLMLGGVYQGVSQVCAGSPC